MLGTSGCSANKRCRDLHGQVLQEYSVVRHGGHCQKTLLLGTAGILCVWARQEYSAVGSVEPHITPRLWKHSNRQGTNVQGPC